MLIVQGERFDAYRNPPHTEQRYGGACRAGLGETGKYERCGICRGGTGSGGMINANLL